MKKKYNSLIKNIGLFTIGSFGSKIIAFLMIPLYTSILDTSDYGTVDIIQSTVSLLMPLLLLSIQDATLRFGMDSNYEKKDVLSTTINIIIKGTLILLFGIIIVSFFNIMQLSISYWIFLFFSFVFGSLNNCFNIYLKAKNDAKTIAIGGIINTFVTCISNVFFLVVLNFGIIGYMISTLIGILLQLIYQVYFGKIYKDIHINNYTNLSKPMIKYSTPLITNSIAWWINNASDRYILTWILGVASNGIYSIAYKIPNILTMFQSIFYNAWSISAISEFNKSDDDGFIGNNYTIYSFLSIVMCSVLLLFNIPIAKILYSGEYYEAWICVPFLLVSSIFNGISQFEGALFAAEKKTKEVSLTTFMGAIINTICNIIFIYKFGILGAAIATLIGYIVTWGLRTIFVRKFVKMKVCWKKHLLSVLLIIVQAIFATNNCLYAVQIIILFCIVLLHREYINKIINKLKKV